MSAGHPGPGSSAQPLPGSCPVPERVVASVPYPATAIPDEKQLFPDGKTPDYKLMFNHFMEEGRLQPEHIIHIADQVAKVFRQEANMVTLRSPITVCGDIHGQFYDLKKLFDLGGDPSNTKYLFLGDYVDRGCFSCEVTLYLFALKLNFPDTFFMIRGNHECRQMTEFFNFREECEYKYCTEVWEAIMDAFDTLPLSAIIDRKFLCLHGGLSPDIQTLQDIQAIDRFCEPPNVGPMCDLLWADPIEDAAQYLELEWGPNTVRGCSYVFGFKAVEPFLLRNRLYSIIRAHEAQLEGYRFYEYCENTEFPSVVTIFSAPNYCDAYNNKGAILKFHDHIFNICQFKCAPHPYYLPNFMDVFTWSVPFVSEKVTEILYDMLGDPGEEDELSEDETDEKAPDAPPKPERTAEEKKARTDQLKTKIRGLMKFTGILKTLRQERETIVKLKGLMGGNLPAGLLGQGKDAIHNALLVYDKARALDLQNEKMPSADAPRPPRPSSGESRSSPRRRGSLTREGTTDPDFFGYFARRDSEVSLGGPDSQSGSPVK